MKKLIVLALAMATFAVHAQSGTSRTEYSERPHKDDAFIHLIPVLGVNSSDLQVEEVDADSGYSIGAYTEFGSSYNQLQTGLTYNSYQQQMDLALVDVKLRQEYLSVPTSYKLNFMGDPTRTVYVKAGLIPSFLTSQRYEYDGWVEGKGKTDAFRKFQMLAQGAVGGSIRAGTGAIVVEGTYVKGLTSALKSTEGKSKTYGTLKAVMITGGYSFPF